MLKFVSSYLRKYKLNLALFSIFLLLSTAASFVVPKILGNYIDGFASAKTASIYIVYAFIAIVLLETIASYLAKYIRNKIANRITLDMIKDLMAHILKLPMDFFKEQEVMYLSNRVNGDSFNLGDFTLKIISSAVINIVALIAAFLYIMHIDFGIGVKLMILIPVYLLIYKLMKKPLFNRSLMCKEQTNEAMGIMDNQYLNIKVTKINNWYEAFEKELTKYTDLAQNSFEKYCKVLFAFDSIDIIIKRLALLILIAYSGNLVLNGRLSPGEFTVLIAYFNIAFDAFTGFVEFAKGYQDAKASYLRIEELLTTKTEINGSSNVHEIEQITLKKVSFCYGEERYLLRDFDYNFERGKIYCIKGKNGIGKSTLTELMLGVNQNYEGQICFNDQELKNVDLYRLRTKMVGFVEQNPNLRDGTLHENLTLGLDDYDFDSISNLCKEFEVDNLMPLGYEDIIKSNNTNLSGGERQKVVICRALGKGAGVIVMDEPTSALDLKSRKKLSEVLSSLKKDKIIILITHDEGLEAIADEIVCLEECS